VIGSPLVIRGIPWLTAVLCVIYCVYNIYNVYTNCSITVGHKRGVFPSNPFLEFQAGVVLICQCSSFCLSMCQFNCISETAVNIFNIFHMMLCAWGGVVQQLGGTKRGVTKWLSPFAQK